jgi:hypothetical protein
LAWFAPHCGTRDGVEVASSGLACLLVVAVTWAAGEERSSPDSPGTSGAHPTDDRRKSALGSKADVSIFVSWVYVAPSCLKEDKESTFDGIGIPIGIF